MSNLTEEVVQDCQVRSGCNALKLVLTPKEKDLGGFSVRRCLPVKQCRNVGPWIFFDHMGPAHFNAGEGIDVRPHPHIGLATVTYLFSGEMLHRDSLGSEQIISPGEINLMVAGRGIVHSERQRREVKATPHDIHGLQLWLALPIEHEQTAPGFYHYDKLDIPETRLDNVSIRVMIGSAYGVTSPVKTFSETLYVEARINNGCSLALPGTRECGVYVVEGSLNTGDTHVEEQSMAIFDDKPGVIVTADKDAVVVIIGGEPLGKRYMEWNFASSDKALIERAKTDWQTGAFAKIPGDDKEFIPLPS